MVIKFKEGAPLPPAELESIIKQKNKEGLRFSEIYIAPFDNKFEEKDLVVEISDIRNRAFREEGTAVIEVSRTLYQAIKNIK